MKEREYFLAPSKIHTIYSERFRQILDRVCLIIANSSAFNRSFLFSPSFNGRCNSLKTVHIQGQMKGQRVSG